MLDVGFPAAHLKHVHREAGGGTVGVARREVELDAVVGQHGVDLMRDGGDQGFKEAGRRDAGCLIGQLHEGELAGPVDADKEIELAFSGLHFGNVNMKETEQVSLELALGGLAAFDLLQSADAVAL